MVMRWLPRPPTKKISALCLRRHRRHTFGTRAVARDMPIDVVQRILGHASLQTTSIYVHAERQRMLDAAAQYYSENGG
jgi:integrase